MDVLDEYLFLADKDPGTISEVIYTEMFLIQVFSIKQKIKTAGIFLKCLF
jgi:hypothetical protein